MDWLTIVLIILATWRVASMLTQEDGPFKMFQRIRRLFGIKHDDGRIFQIPDRNMAKLFTCLWCMSLWVGGIMYGIWLVAPIVVWILAISTGAIIVDRLTEGSHGNESG